MRTLSQFVGVLLVIGIVGAYFWWIVTVVAVVGLAWLAIRAYPVARAPSSKPTLGAARNGPRRWYAGPISSTPGRWPVTTAAFMVRPALS
jgi:hypothetical protein